MRRYIREKLIHFVLAMTGRPVKDRLIFARRFQYLDRDAIDAYQVEQLGALLGHFYRLNLIDKEPKLKPHDKQDLQSILSAFAPMDKVQLVETYTRLANGPHSTGRSAVKHTSGSSGNPVVVLKDNYGIACELAATWRSYEWAGIKPGDRGIRVWGRKASINQRMRQILSNIVLNRSRIEVTDLDGPACIKRLELIRRNKPKYIYGYTSIVKELATVASETGCSHIPSLVAIVTTAEPLDVLAKKVIEEGFGVRCFNEYGCSEVGSIAHECEHGSLHIMADNLVVETITKDGASVVGEEGELVVTDLTNRRMPLIRYRLGDYGVLSSKPCPCGRGLPVLDYVYGRVIDLLVTPDGRTHHSAPIFYIVDELSAEFQCIRQFQVVQESPSFFLLNVVPLDDARVNAEVMAARFTDLLKNQLHPDLEGKVKFVGCIEREPSGKFRTIKRTFIA